MEAASSEVVSPIDDCDRPLRVLIDGRKIGDGGIGVYTDNLISGLADLGGLDITVIARPGLSATHLQNLKISWVFDKARPYSLDELLLMPKRLRTKDYDLFHAPHYMLPYRLSIPSVVTVHDLIHITHPERFFYPPVARILIGSAVKRASAVLAVSRATQDQIVHEFGVPREKTAYIPNAIARYVSDGIVADDCPAHEASPFFLAIFSNAKPHKGLMDLLLAYQVYRESGAWRALLSGPPSLVVAGYGTSQITLSSSLLRGVDIQGAISDSKLASLYRRATVLVVPSLVEGFCLPALEAQAVGTPVVCRPVPALRELVSARDVVADDFSIEGLVQSLHRGLVKSAISPREIDCQHLSRFSRAGVAQSVKDVYLRVARGVAAAC